MSDHTTGLILSQIAQHATEVAAIASARLRGFGRKNDADQAAVDAVGPAFGVVSEVRRLAYGQRVSRATADLLEFNRLIGHEHPAAGDLTVSFELVDARFVELGVARRP